MANLQRLSGSYSIRSQPIQQFDYQFDPKHWATIEGFKLPIKGAFTQVRCAHGTAVLYVSEPGEVPLYYAFTPGQIHWHEQKLALPKGAQRIKSGSMLVWTPEEWYDYKFDWLPRPPIREKIVSKHRAIAEYGDRLVAAVMKRLRGAKRVAVAQSGGKDSLMVTWALLQAGVEEIYPLCVCAADDNLDITGARSGCTAMGLEVIPIVVKPEDLESLSREAIVCLEDDQVDDIKTRMAMGNILMARKCQELGVDLIFTGYGQDLLFGYKNHQSVFQEGSPAEKWRDARWGIFANGQGMFKMWASTFRRYGIQPRAPYFDTDVVEWAFSQPIEILPIEPNKQFVHDFGAMMLPPGEHQEVRHTRGYATGAGLSLGGKFLRGEHKVIFDDKRIRQYASQLKHLPLDQRIALHDPTQPTRTF